MFHSRGKRGYADGHVDQGEFANGIRHGKGKCTVRAKRARAGTPQGRRQVAYGSSSVSRHRPVSPVKGWYTALNLSHRSHNRRTWQILVIVIKNLLIEKLFHGIAESQKVCNGNEACERCRLFVSCRRERETKCKSLRRNIKIFQEILFRTIGEF